MKAIIFGGASIESYDFCTDYIKIDDLSNKSNYVVICCDRGLLHSHNLNILPDCVVGDFDSVDSKLLNLYKKNGIHIEKYPKHKDCTDLELGISIAIDRYNVCEIIIFGGIGNRIDHTFANMHLLYMLENKGINACLIDRNNYITITSSKQIVSGKKGDTVSILPFMGDAFGVTLEGFEYPLYNFDMSYGKSLGVSNVLLSSEGIVKLKKGYLVIIKAND